jgi:single-strand DNA-binding protein
MALPKIDMTCRIGKDPELTFTKQGHAVLKLRTVASNSVKSGSGVWQTTAECWLDVVYYGLDAETLFGSLPKGQQIFVKGDLVTRNWEAKDGTKRTAVEVKAQVIAPVQRNETAPVTAEPADPWASVPAATDNGGTNVPF